MLSRVADNMYWMSRYIERAEHTARLVATVLSDLIERGPDDVADSWIRLYAALGRPVPETAELDAERALKDLVFTRDNPGSVISCMASARENARQVREQITSEMWERLNGVYIDVKNVEPEEVYSGRPAEFCLGIIDNLFLFRGILEGTMNHGEEWRWIGLGTHLERAQLVSRLLDLHYGTMPPGVPSDLRAPGLQDWSSLLEMCGAFEAYCKVYTANLQPARIAEFLIFDGEFPRSVRYAVDQMERQLQQIAPDSPLKRRGKAERVSGRLKATLDFGQLDEVMSGSIHRYLSDVQAQCQEIHAAIFTTYIAYPLDAHLTA